jgi:hypothetical protein
VGYPDFVVVVVNGERPLSGIWTLFSHREKKKVWWLRGSCFEGGKEMAWIMAVVPGERRHFVEEEIAEIPQN